jgi:GGDEF domain-containing protein
MAMAELAIWAGMAGALALLFLVAVAECLVQRTVGTVRGVAFVALMGSAAIILSGLPEQFLPRWDSAVFLPLKVTIGPLSGALALRYLGFWLGTARDDRLTRRTVKVTSVVLILLSVAIVFFASHLEAWHLLMWAGGMYLTMVAVALFVSARAVALGDGLARWMVVACMFLWVAVMGLVTKSLESPGFGLPGWGLTAFSTVAYFLIVIALTIRRTRELRRLRLLAKGVVAQEFNIPMPQGSQLIPRVADVMWRSQRMERPCVVAAITVRNLYELADELGHGVEAEILAVLAARIRRHVGFRNVVGLYHPRCFVLAVSSGQDPRRGELLVSSLLKSVRNRVRVGPPDQRFDFWPEVGVGVVEVQHSPLDALQAIDSAEQLANEDLDTDYDELLSHFPGPGFVPPRPARRP